MTPAGTNREGICIDCHSHWVSPGYVEQFLAHAAVDEGFGRFHAGRSTAMQDPDSPLRRIDLRLAGMDAAGVDVSVLSLPPPATTFGDPVVRRTIARSSNDDLLELADQHPGRFAVLVSLPLPDGAGSLDELERVAAHPAARGVNVPTATEGWTIDDPRVEPVLGRAAALGLPVFTHPAIEAVPAAFDDWSLSASLAPVVSSSLGVARLVYAGVLDRLPALDLIVPHLGGTLPFLQQRFTDFGRGRAKHDLAHYLQQRLYLDTCSFHPPALRCAIETVGADRLVLGSDQPYRGELARAVRDVREVVVPELQHLVLGATAARWFAP